MGLGVMVATGFGGGQWLHLLITRGLGGGLGKGVVWSILIWRSLAVYLTELGMVHLLN